MRHIDLQVFKRLALLFTVLIILLVLLVSVFVSARSIKGDITLKQVVILSRHSVRTPLSSNLAEISPKPWPHWKEKSGHLTPKGALLEGYMGVFFSEWLLEQKLLPKGCPIKEDVFVYANVVQRTIATAKAFVNKAFPNCNVTVHHSKSDKTDPVFNPVIHNSTEAFKRLALQDMQTLLDKLSLKDSYVDLSAILDYENSVMCKRYKNCDLTTDTNEIIDVDVGFKPKIQGPLKICSSANDAFVMEYYEGMKDVAWGGLNDAKEWKKIMDLSRGYHNVIFNTSIIAQDISKPLRKYMTKIFLTNTYKPKLVLLMGHDANIHTILNSMKFKPYNLKDQHEHTPVGGKILFQRLSDETTGKDFLKLDYVYQTNTQLRNGIKLSLENPPQIDVLEMENCKIDENGFCPWDNFVKLLNDL